MARIVVDVPGLAQLRIDYAALLLRVIALEAALAAGGGTLPPTPSTNIVAYWSSMQ